MATPVILCDTAGMSEAQWLACREHGPKGDIGFTVGGSDVAAIFGLFLWMTPLELWMQKKGRMKAKPKPNPGQLAMGHLLEPIAAHFYAERTGNTVTDDTNLYQHADFPYALANFDRRYVHKTDGLSGILECKSCTYHKADDWKDGAYPLYYEMQLRYYLAVADVEHGAFSAIWGNNPEADIAMPEIQRDRAKEDMIFQRLDEWIWSLRNDKPPDMGEVAPKTALESLARIYGASRKGLPTTEFPKKHEKTLRQIAALQGENDALKTQIKKNEEAMAAFSVRIAELMRNHEHGVLETAKDKLLVDFVTRTTRRVNSDFLKKEHPAIYQDALRTSESRKLKVSIQPV
jgi:putative phage-type endonuclease